MADAFAAIVGSVLMIGYIVLISAKLDALPLWICSIAGLALMLWGFWQDDWKPLFRRRD